MKHALTIAVVLTALSAVEATAAESKDGQVPQSVLASFGLGGMEIMSDKAGMRIRGQGLGASDVTFVAGLNSLRNPSKSVVMPLAARRGLQTALRRP